ncbi:restriction endonuclease subunit S [Candidatus Woesearchaeota archaeon]|nr:restriction endonuclease subunit S [Candidatus Woesearchaeota archaeon]
MKPYPKYKESGIQWIGKIPEGWSIEKTKYVFEEINQKSIDGSGTLLSVSEYYGVAPRCNKIEADDFLTHAESLEGYKVCKVNDIVMNIMLAWKKSLGVSAWDGIVSPAYAVFRLKQKDFSPQYFHHLFRTDQVAAEFRRNSTGIIDSRLRLYPEKFFSIKISFPPFPEQQQIASFLDTKTSLIDEAIEKKERLIELLEEERTGKINHAVTRGLNPKMELKDSGVEWLGKVPKHWDVKKLKFVAHLQSGESITSDAIKSDGSFPVYGGNGFRGFTEAYTHDGHYALVGRQGALCGNVNYASGKFWASEHAVVATLLNINEVIWFGELIRTMNLNQYSMTAAQPGLSVDVIKNLKVPVPSTLERQAIEIYLHQETQKIDQTINKIQKEIELLHEYRTALISEAVTGKIDVRGLA